MAIDTSWIGDFSKVKAKAQVASKTTPAKTVTPAPAQTAPATATSSPEGSLRYYESQGLSFKDAQAKMAEYQKAQKLASTVKAYQDAQSAKVNPFNPMDEFQKFLDSKDDTYWQGVEQVAGEKVNPYYDRLKAQLGEQLGIDKAQLGLQKENNQKNYDADIADITRMSSYAKDDFAKNLTKTDRAFASTIQRATEAYGQRNLLNSGVQAYGNLMSAKDQQGTKDAMQSGLDKTIGDLEASRQKAFNQYDITNRSLALKDQELNLTDQQKQDKINRDRATELEVARSDTDSGYSDRALGDISKYAQQSGAIPTGNTPTPAKTANLSTVKTLQTKATAPKKFAKPLLI